MMLRFRLCRLLAFLIFPGMLAAQSDDLLTRIWDGVQQAQKKYTSGCGTITETRTSSLMVKPMVLRGKFCAEGTTRFMLEYFEPAPFRIRFNENYLNVTTAAARRRYWKSEAAFAAPSPISAGRTPSGT